MKKIGIISDTHGTFDAPLRQFLAQVDEIWHAGDVGSVELADTIAAFKPLRAVWGNIDDGGMRRMFPKTDIFACEGLKVTMTHIGTHGGRFDPAVAEVLRTERPDIFVSGHSHILKIFRPPAPGKTPDETLGTTPGPLCVNPGAAGCYGSHAVRTAVRLTIDGKEVSRVEVGQWPR